MNRNIRWQTGAFDEMEFVYEKAMEKEQFEKALEELERLALSEAKNNCGLLTTKAGGHVTPEQFDGLSDNDRETVIRALSDIGSGT